jgi:asparagine synthase (glutamine-hydrolysing)
MCGIAGVFAHARERRVDADTVAAMTKTLAHRGPDGDGLRIALGYGLGHRRLAIVDVATGQQPMPLPGERLWITFNGEIYNHLDLRRELEGAGCVFRTRSDTEVLLHGYRQWGTALAARLRGMFAFAIVSARSRSTSPSATGCSRSHPSSRRCTRSGSTGGCAPTRSRSSSRCATCPTR